MYKIIKPENEQTKDWGAKGILFHCDMCNATQKVSFVVQGVDNLEGNSAILSPDDLKECLKNYPCSGCGKLGIGLLVDDIDS